MTPIWLPSLIDTDGVWEEVLKRLFRVFKKDFITDGCRYDGLSVNWDHRKVDSPYEEGFWHLISKDDQITKERLFDPPRAKRLPWCKPCIENNQDDTVKVWETRRKGRIQVYIWLENYDYVVILQKRSRAVFLMTAYYIVGKSSRKKMRAKYNQRIH